MVKLTQVLAGSLLQVQGLASRSSLVKTIFSGNYSVESILETAEGYLLDVTNMNLESFSTLLSIYEEHDPELVQKKFDSIRPEYLKPIVLGYARGVAKGSFKSDQYVVFDQLEKEFHDIPHKLREQELGRYSTWSRLEQKMSPEEFAERLDFHNRLSRLFGFVIVVAEGSSVLLKSESHELELLGKKYTLHENGYIGYNGYNRVQDSVKENSLPNVPHVPKSVESVDAFDESTMKVRVHFLKEVSDPIVGSDFKEYGPFLPGAIAHLPQANAEIFVEQGTAEYCGKNRGDSNG